MHEVRSWNGKWLSGAPPPTGMRHFHYESDASGYGAGLVMDDPQVEMRWHWRDDEKPHSINWKELLTPVIGLPKVHKVTGKLNNSVINGKLDNTTAIAYIRHQGGPKLELSAPAEKFWRWLLSIGSWTTATHLAGVLNVRADRASRWRDDRSEWRLSDRAFAEVERLYGPHTVDLFASRRNALLPRFFSRWLDPESAATDAMQRPWHLEGNPYGHPPIAMIPKIITKLKQERSEITLVAPLWPTQAWISDLMDLSVDVPHLLLCKNVLQSWTTSPSRSRQPGWSTVVWRLSGDASKTKVTRARLRRVLWPATRTATS